MGLTEQITCSVDNEPGLGLSVARVDEAHRGAEHHEAQPYVQIPEISVDIGTVLLTKLIA